MTAIHFIFKAADDNTAQSYLKLRNIKANFVSKDRYEFHYRTEGDDLDKIISWFGETNDRPNGLRPMGSCLFYSNNRPMRKENLEHAFIAFCKSMKWDYMPDFENWAKIDANGYAPAIKAAIKAFLDSAGA